MLNQLLQLLTKDNIYQDEPMRKHTSFKIGGTADFLVTPNSREQFTALVKLLYDSNTPTFIMGNGSNLLVSDDGIRGVVIKTSMLNNCTVKDDTITAGCGILLSRLATEALNHSLGGMEFAHGIPGTFGGGVVMNAGAYGGELKNIVLTSEYTDETCSIKTITDHNFSYRHSFFTNKPHAIVLQSTIKLNKTDPIKIKERMTELSLMRSNKQPLDMPSAGSVFKRPEGSFAGKLISDAGLKGFSIGGAQVSEKHAGFIINRGGATAQDVKQLIDHIQKTVYSMYNILLECEVKIVD